MQQYQTPTKGRAGTCRIQCQTANAGPQQTVWLNASEARWDVFQAPWGRTLTSQTKPVALSGEMGVPGALDSCPAHHKAGSPNTSLNQTLALDLHPVLKFWFQVCRPVFSFNKYFKESASIQSRYFFLSQTSKRMGKCRFHFSSKHSAK